MGKAHCMALMLLLLIAASFPVAGAEENLVKNAGFEDGAAGWSLPASYGVVTDTAHSGTQSLRVVNKDKKVYLLASRKVAFTPGMKYHFSAWVRTQGVEGEDSGATLCMEWTGAKGWLGGSYPAGKKGDQDWFLVEGETPPIPKDARDLSIVLYLRKGMTGTAWFDDVTVRSVFPQALSCALLRPNYRDTILPGTANPNITVCANVADLFPGGLGPKDTTLEGLLRRGEETLQTKRIVSPAAGANELSFDAAALRPGEYQVQVRLIGPNRQVMVTATLSLRKAAADEGQPAVVIDEHNRTLVNGKPFFPLGWYFGPGPKDKNFREHLDRLAGSPFNTIMCYGINSGTIEDVRAYLDALAERNLKIIYSIKDVYQGTPWYQDKQLGFQGEDAIVNGVVSAFRDHPAVLGWYLNDELPLSMRERLEARYRQVRELDPNHPTWSVLYQVDELAGYLNTADVLGTDPYPLPHKPVTMAGEWTRKSAAASGGKRPLWQVPQAHDWACYSKDPQAKHRPPTLDEEMVMSYLCLIHGANGLIYYSYFDLQRDSLGFNRRWAEMRVVGEEMKQLIPALLSTAAAPKLDVQTDNASVEYSQRADDAGNQYVLMANPDNEKPAVVTVQVPAGAQLALLRHATLGAQPVGRDGQCRVRLAPMSAATLIVTP